MTQEQRGDAGERGLDEIRREVIESRNLVIKNDNLLKNLHAELKLVSKRHDDFQRRQWINSAMAYFLFALLTAGAAYLVNNARLRAVTGEKEQLQRQVSELTFQMERQKTEQAQNANAAHTAGEVFRMMTALPGDERLKGVDALAKLDTSRLTPLERLALADRAEILRKEIGATAFERGKNAFRRLEFPQAVEDLTRFMALNPPPEESLDAAFFLGSSLVQVRKPDQAIPHLARFVTEDKKSKSRDYAMLMLAQAYEQTGQYEKAAATARDAIGTYPASEFLGQLRIRLSAAKRAMSAASDGGTTTGGSAPGGGTAVPAPTGAAPAAAGGAQPAGGVATPAEGTDREGTTTAQAGEPKPANPTPEAPKPAANP